MNIRTLSVGFLGSGRMATALAKGFCRTFLSAERLVAADPDQTARSAFKVGVGPQVVLLEKAAGELFATDILFLAVKPQVLPDAVRDLADRFNPEQLVVSIAAGVRISQLETLLPTGARVIRVMPNTPCLVGTGACGISGGTHAMDSDLSIVTQLLKSVGIVELVPERLLDAVTGLSGSGPAYVFQMIEALSDGGVRMGLPRKTATRLAAQTLLGASQMVLETEEHPRVLKDAVTSPGGTTIAALQALEGGGLRAALIKGVETA